MKTWRGAGARAERLRVRPWTDPRLLLGVLLVLGATVLGARAFAAADHSVAYWTAAHDVRAGDRLTRADLVSVDVRLTGEAGELYIAVADTLPAEIDQLQWSQDLPAGGLVGRHDLVARRTASSRQLPVSVAEGSMPRDLRRGDHVEVWVGASPGDEQPEPARRVLDDVTVLRAGTGDRGLEGSGARSVLLQVPPDALGGDVVSAVAAGHVTLIGLP